MQMIMLGPGRLKPWNNCFNPLRLPCLCLRDTSWEVFYQLNALVCYCIVYFVDACRAINILISRSVCYTLSIYSKSTWSTIIEVVPQTWVTTSLPYSFGWSRERSFKNFTNPYCTIFEAMPCAWGIPPLASEAKFLAVARFPLTWLNYKVLRVDEASHWNMCDLILGRLGQCWMWAPN